MTHKHWAPWSPSSGIAFHGINGTRLFDLCLIKLSVSRSSLLGESIMNICHPFKIYGSILLMDDKGNEFYLFHRESQDETAVRVHVDDDDHISFTLEKFHYKHPRCLPNTFCLVFYLKEALTQSVIVDQVKFIDTTAIELPNGHDQIHDFQFESDIASVTVEYTILQCALIADVSLIIEKNQ